MPKRKLSESARQALYSLCTIKGLGSRTLLELLEADAALADEAAETFAIRLLQSEADRADILDRLIGPDPESSRRVRLQRLLTEQPRDTFIPPYTRLQDLGIGFVTILEEGYPARLRSIPDPPFQLFYKGRVPPGETPMVSIIGARTTSPYGREMAREFGRGIAQLGVPVVSGMARGVDGISQRAALEAGAASYGVLGCGVDQVYPRENRDLYDALVRQGGILSEYPPGTRAAAQLFPARNRIISGLSSVLLVVEARSRSGTMITVDQALEQGRTVCALPGRLTDPLSSGCLRLIRDGARLVTTPYEVLSAMDPSAFPLGDAREQGGEDLDRAAADPAGALQEPEASICKVLREEGEMSQETLGERVSARLKRRIGVSELNRCLMQLILKGLVRETEGGRFDFSGTFL